VELQQKVNEVIEYILVMYEQSRMRPTVARDNCCKYGTALHSAVTRDKRFIEAKEQFLQEMSACNRVVSDEELAVTLKNLEEEVKSGTSITRAMKLYCGTADTAISKRVRETDEYLKILNYKSVQRGTGEVWARVRGKIVPKKANPVKSAAERVHQYK